MTTWLKLLGLTTGLLLAAPMPAEAGPSGFHAHGLSDGVLRLGLAASEVPYDPPSVDWIRPPPRPWEARNQLGVTFDSFDMKYGKGTSDNGHEFPAGSFAGSGYGVYGVISSIGVSAWKVSGKFTDAGVVSPTWDFTAVGLSLVPSLRVYLDLGDPDIRLGLGLPEPFVRYSWGSSEGMDIHMLTLGVAVLVGRVSFYEVAYLEARLGAVSYDLQIYSYPDPTTGTGDSVSQYKFNLGLAPTVRAGVTW